MDYIRKGDGRAHAFTATPTDKAGPVDLPFDSTVAFRAKLPGASAFAIDKLAAIDSPGALVGDPGRGKVRYDPVEADLATPGLFDAEWLVTLPDTTPQRFPEDGWLKLTILP